MATSWLWPEQPGARHTALLVALTRIGTPVLTLGPVVHTPAVFCCQEVADDLPSDMRGLINIDLPVESSWFSRGKPLILSLRSDSSWHPKLNVQLLGLVPSRHLQGMEPPVAMMGGGLLIWNQEIGEEWLIVVNGWNDQHILRQWVSTMLVQLYN